MPNFICLTPSAREPYYANAEQISGVTFQASGSALVVIHGGTGYPVRDTAGVRNLRRLVANSFPIPHQFIELMRSVEGVLAEFGAVEPGAVEKRGDVEAPASMLLDQLYLAWNECMREIHSEADADCVPVPVEGTEVRSL